MWEESFVCRLGGDWIYIRCLSEDEVYSVLHRYHPSTYGGHFGQNKMATEVLEEGFYWPTLFKDARKFIITSDRCHRTGNFTKSHEMPQSGTLEMDLFDVWGLT